MKVKYINLLGTLVLFITFALAWYWFTWKLALVLFLALFGNNLERYVKNNNNN